MEHQVDLDELEGEAPATVAGKQERVGFLPIVTNWFDRVFIGIYLFVALELFWMRFLEQSIPLTVCHLLALALGVLIVWRG
jgi:predicted small integral membrane protein